MKKNISPTFRKADTREADEISKLAIRSKAYWGYSTEFMQACEDELTVTEQLINSHNLEYWVVEVGSELVGFYALEKSASSEYELEALFVEPLHIGMGFGKALISHAKKRTKSLGAEKLVIQGDPHAENFYMAAGGVKIGSRKSCSIPGRELPLFLIEL